MGYRGSTQGTILVNYSRSCIRCDRDGVVIDPWRQKPGRLCAECLISAMSELFLLSEAHDILTGAEDELD